MARWIRKDAKAERPGPSWLAPSKRHFFGRDFIPLSAFGRPRPGATAPPPRRTGASLSSSAVAIVVPNKSKGNRHSPAKRITSFAGCTGSVHSAGQPHVAVPGAGGDALPAFRCKGAASGRGADHRVPEQHRPDRSGCVERRDKAGFVDHRREAHRLSEDPARGPIRLALVIEAGPRGVKQGDRPPAR